MKFFTVENEDGLNVHAVRAKLVSSQPREEQAADLVAAHIEQCSGYIAWSGGKDSTAAAHLTLQRNPEVPLVWFHSGLEFPETEEYIHEIAEKWGKEVTVFRAEPDALTLLEKSGFWDHDAPFSPTVENFHETLISKPSRAAHDIYGPGEVLGLRAYESAARRALLAPRRGVYARTDGTRVCAPLWSWTDNQVVTYLANHNIPLNPVYAKLASLGVPERDQRAGLVIDGNGLDRGGRATWLRLGWPNLWADLCERLPRLQEWR